MGPSSIPLASQPSPRAPKVLSPKTSRPRNTPIDPPPEYPKRATPKNQPAQERPDRSSTRVPQKGYAQKPVGPITPRSILRPSTPKGLRPKASRPRNARLILRPGTPTGLGQKPASPGTPGQFSAQTPGCLISGMPFYPGAYFPDRQLHQTRLPTGSSCYKCKFSHNTTS